jgi:hypothetical protein
VKGLIRKYKEKKVKSTVFVSFASFGTTPATGLAGYAGTILWFEGKIVEQVVRGVNMSYGLNQDPVDIGMNYILAKGPQTDRSRSVAGRQSIANLYQSYRLVGVGTGVIECSDEYVNDDMEQDIAHTIVNPGDAINLYVGGTVVADWSAQGSLEVKETWTQVTRPDIMSEHEQDMLQEEDFEDLGVIYD